MISKDLESKIITALTSAMSSVTTPHQIVGSWRGAVTEDESSVAVIAVAVATPDMPTFSTPTVEFGGSVTLAVRQELDADGSVLVSLADKIMTLFQSWQSQTYQRAFTALDVSGLSVDEFAVTGGNLPQFDRDSRVTSVSFPFKIYGTFL